MKVLVLSPPTESTTNVVRDLIYGCWCKGKRIAGAKSPPTNLLYVATILKQQGHDVRLLDATAEFKTAQYVKKIISEFDAVIESTSTMTFRREVDDGKPAATEGDIAVRKYPVLVRPPVVKNPVHPLNQLLIRAK